MVGSSLRGVRDPLSVKGTSALNIKTMRKITKYIFFILVIIFLFFGLSAVNVLTDPVAQKQVTGDFQDDVVKAAPMLKPLKGMLPILGPGLIMFMLVWGILSEANIFKRNPNVNVGIGIAIGAISGLYTPLAAFVIYMFTAGTVWFLALIITFGLHMLLLKMEHMQYAGYETGTLEGGEEITRGEAKILKEEAMEVHERYAEEKREAKETERVLRDIKKRLGSLRDDIRSATTATVHGRGNEAYRALQKFNENIAAINKLEGAMTSDFKGLAIALKDYLNSLMDALKREEASEGGGFKDVEHLKKFYHGVEREHLLGLIREDPSSIVKKTEKKIEEDLAEARKAEQALADALRTYRNFHDKMRREYETLSREAGEGGVRHDVSGDMRRLEALLIKLEEEKFDERIEQARGIISAYETVMIAQAKILMPLAVYASMIHDGLENPKSIDEAKNTVNTGWLHFLENAKDGVVAQHENRIFLQLTASGEDIAKLAGDLIGKPIEFQDISKSIYEKAGIGAMQSDVA